MRGKGEHVGGMHGGGPCMAEGHVWQEACMVRQCAWQGHVW